MTSLICSTCGRRHRPRRARTPAPMPLFDWHPPAPRRTPCGARLMLRDDLRDAEGEPRACLVIPGRRLPVAFPSITMALAALATLEVAHAGR
jgi:hypothetical protein